MLMHLVSLTMEIPKVIWGAGWGVLFTHSFCPFTWIKARWGNEGTKSHVSHLPEGERTNTWWQGPQVSRFKPFSSLSIFVCYCSIGKTQGHCGRGQAKGVVDTGRTIISTCCANYLPWISRFAIISHFSNSVINDFLPNYRFCLLVWGCENFLIFTMLLEVSDERSDIYLFIYCLFLNYN